jgi:hypothetical protein
MAAFSMFVMCFENVMCSQKDTAALRFPNLEIAWHMAVNELEQSQPHPRLHIQYNEKLPPQFKFLSQSGSILNPNG